MTAPGGEVLDRGGGRNEAPGRLYRQQPRRTHLETCSIIHWDQKSFRQAAKILMLCRLKLLVVGVVVSWRSG
eukprot:g28201.t1